MEHMETDLGQVLRTLSILKMSMVSVARSKQELTEEHCQYLSYQMLRGLSYLHSANVVHQRLRPRSVLVNRSLWLRKPWIHDSGPLDPHVKP